jgi:hypothetical protein
LANELRPRRTKNGQREQISSVLNAQSGNGPADFFRLHLVAIGLAGEYPFVRFASAGTRFTPIFVGQGEFYPHEIFNFVFSHRLSFNGL